MIASSESSRPLTSRRNSVVSWVVLGLLIVIASALIMYFGRGLTFLRDEWTFVLYRDGHDATNFFSSYAGHLLLWPTAFYVFLFKAVGLDHYELYRLAALFFHLACALLVFLLARRRVGDVVALAPATIILFLGSAWMDLLWPFQIAFTGAIAFGLGAILVLDRDDLVGDALACLCLLVAIGWSGAALPFLPGVAVGLLVRGRFWRRIWVPGVPGVAYLLWEFKYGEQQAHSGLVHVPDYALKMAEEGLTGITGLSLATSSLLLVLLGVVVAIRLWQLGLSSPLAWEALTMAVVFWGLTALARSQEHDPTAVRYIYPSVVFLLLLAVGVAPKGPPRRVVTAMILPLAALALPSNISGFENGRRELVFSSNIVSAELGAVQLARGVVPPEFTPELNGFLGGVTAAPFFAATDRYGSSPADTPEEIAESPPYARRRADATSIAALAVRLDATSKQVRLGPEPIELRASVGRVAKRPGSCATVAGPGRLAAAGVLPAAGALIEGSPSSPVTVGLRRFASTFHQVKGSVPQDGAALLRIPRDGERRRPWRLRVAAGAGPVKVCPLATAPATSSG